MGDLTKRHDEKQCANELLDIVLDGADPREILEKRLSIMEPEDVIAVLQRRKNAEQFMPAYYESKGSE